MQTGMFHETIPKHLLLFYFYQYLKIESRGGSKWRGKKAKGENKKNLRKSWRQKIEKTRRATCLYYIEYVKKSDISRHSIIVSQNNSGIKISAAIL